MGCAVSKSVHVNIVGEKDAEIAQLEAKLRAAQDGEQTAEARRRASQSQLELTETEKNKHMSTNEEQQAIIDAMTIELAEATSKLGTTSSDLTALREQYDNETSALASAKRELERAIKLSKEAVATLHCQTDDELELEAPTPEVAAVIDAKDTSIPHDLKETVRSVQDSVTEMKIMQKQIDLAQRKVNEYWKRIQAHEALILSQKKQILTIKNKNEKLRHSDPNKRAMKRRNSTSSHPAEPVLVH
jgi:hypothetical protein